MLKAADAAVPDIPAQHRSAPVDLRAPGWQTALDSVFAKLRGQIGQILGIAAKLQRSGYTQ